jgi:hypothetical protein
LLVTIIGFFLVLLLANICLVFNGLFWCFLVVIVRVVTIIIAIVFGLVLPLSLLGDPTVVKDVGGDSNLELGKGPFKGQPFFCFIVMLFVVGCKRGCLSEAFIKVGRKFLSEYFLGIFSNYKSYIANV